VPQYAPPPAPTAPAAPGLDNAKLEQLLAVAQTNANTLARIEHMQKLHEMAITYLFRRAWHESWILDPATGQSNKKNADPATLEDFSLEKTLKAMGFQDVHLPH
jgi:hypothetical protein